ncbi:MAG TPA: hypothetical protein VF507_08405 [Pyrinomonadaceae bacterium]|jgi:hypothetical protein
MTLQFEDRVSHGRLGPGADLFDSPGDKQPGGADAGLDEAARKEREYVRERLRSELKREPTEEELNEWLRRHTEGY